MDNTAPNWVTLCHSQSSPQILSSSGNQMYIYFKSDVFTAGRGFNLTYKAIIRGKSLKLYGQVHLKSH